MAKVWKEPGTYNIRLYNGHTHTFVGMADLLKEAGRPTYIGEVVRENLTTFGIDLTKLRRKLEDDIRKDPIELCRILGAWLDG